MDIALLESAVKILSNDLTNTSVITTIETGLDSVFNSIAIVGLKASKDNTLVNTIDDLLASVHAKIDGALHTFIHLSEIAKELIAQGQVAANVLRQIYNLMLSIIQSLKPVEDLVCKYYPVLAPVFILLNSLPKI